MDDQITSAEWRLMMSKKHSGKYKQGSANELTKTIIQWLNWNGFIVWRNNTMGVFDVTAAAALVFNLVKVSVQTKKIPNKKDIRAGLNKCYRKSHERKGASDILGYQKKTGRFIAIEVKHGKDKLSIEQKAFLDQVHRNGGISIVARSIDGFLSSIEAHIQ